MIMYLIFSTIFRGPPYLCSKSSYDASEKSAHSKLASEDARKKMKSFIENTRVKMMIEVQHKIDNVILLMIVHVLFPSNSGLDASETFSESATPPVWRPHQPSQNSSPSRVGYEVSGSGSHPGPGTVTNATGDANSLELCVRVEAAVSHDTSPSVADLLLLHQLNVYLFTARSLRRSLSLLMVVVIGESIVCCCCVSCSQALSCAWVPATCPSYSSSLALLPAWLPALSLAVARAGTSNEEIHNSDKIRDEEITRTHDRVSIVSCSVDGLIMTDYMTDHRPIHPTDLILIKLPDLHRKSYSVLQTCLCMTILSEMS